MATITGNRKDITGLPDTGDLWFKPTTPTENILSPRRRKAAIDDDGDFTIELQAGTAEVTIFNKAVRFTIPEGNGTYTLWSRIAAQIALPPETSQAKLNAAITQIIDSGATEILTQTVADATYAPMGNYATTEQVTTQVSDQVPPLVADAIANDATIEQAAIDAVGSVAEPIITEQIGGFGIAKTLSPTGEIAFAVTDAEGNLSWLAVALDGTMPDYTKEVLRELFPLDTQESQFAFAVVDADDNTSWLAVNRDGSIPDHTIEQLAEALGADLADSDAFALPNMVHEWWINDAYTWLGDRLVGTVYGGDDGTIHAIEWRPGFGITVDVVVGSTAQIDDHNSPGHHAEHGRRAIMVWNPHNADNLLRAVASDQEPNFATFADNPVLEIENGEPVSYGSPIKIHSLSNVAQDTFWVPIRAGGATAAWDIHQLSVNQATGVITVGTKLKFLSAGGQFYCSFADAFNPTGDQIIRVAATYNPAHPNNPIFYFEINAATGVVTNPFGTLSHNVKTAPARFDVHTTTPALAQDETVDRRLHYVTAGPYKPRFLFAEWPAGNVLADEYFAFDVNTATRTNYGPAHKEFGYTAEANYLPGMCAPSPAYDDTVFLCRDAGPGDEGTIERVWTRRGVLTFDVLQTFLNTTPIRPLRPKNGGPLVIFFDMSSYADFVTTGVLRSTLER
jgi:hypothetical protein